MRRLPSKAVDALTPSSSVCTNDEVLAKRAEDLARLNRAIARGTVFAHANPDAAIRLVWKYEPRARPAPGEEQRALERDRIGLKVRLQNHGIVDPNKPNLGGVSAAENQVLARFSVRHQGDLEEAAGRRLLHDRDTGLANDFDAPALVKRAKEFKI